MLIKNGNHLEIIRITKDKSLITSLAIIGKGGSEVQ